MKYLVMITPFSPLTLLNYLYPALVDLLSTKQLLHGKEWDAKFLEALVSERMKELITKHCPKMHLRDQPIIG